MKKALIVSNSSGLVSDFLVNDIQILNDMEYEIECACNTNFPGKDTKNFFKKYNIKTLQIDFPIRDLNINQVLQSYRLLNKIISNNKYDIIHCHSTIAAALARQCAKKKRKTGLIVIYTSHGLPFYKGAKGKKAKLFYYIEKYYSKFTDAIITICDEDYKNACKLKSLQVFHINGTGIELSKFNNADIDRNKYRKQLGFMPDNKIILSIGEINTNKNHEVVIKALSLLNDKNIVYIVCGREVTEVGKKEELKQLAKDLGVKLEFLGFRKDIPDVCHCADIGAIPSFKEGLGLSGVEMLASGIPVVGSDRQGIKDYVVDGVTGYLCNPDSPQSFALGIRQGFTLCSDQNIVTNCIKMSQKFDVKNAYNTMYNIYTKLLRK